MNYIYLAAIPLAAFLWAKMEIEIEGSDGWAGNLPTWKVEQHKLLDWFYGGRPLTGYHVWAFAFVFFAFHLPLFWAETWSIRLEMAAVGSYVLFWVIEDFLWFIFNPQYGLRKFSHKHIWWHKHWFLGLPSDYWILGTTGSLLLFASSAAF